MNKAKLKTYAPQARRDFILAVTDRAAYFGLTAKKTEPVVEKGDVAVIGGRSFPIAVARKRKALEDRIKRHGFEQTMEAMAYTWFNRLVAIRFMELHGYLDHGYRVLSRPRKTTDGTDSTDVKDGTSTSAAYLSVQSVKSVVETPEILDHAEHVELPGLKKEVVIDLKLAGNKEGELYRLLLTAQCNALHTAMPFLFERIDDETELLLPDNLLNSDSLMRNLVGEIEEEDWNEVEIIGWLYQFYISEKKDEVIGKVVASEDIPAATQLFTPNWIVKYLVQNTLGRQWLEHHPHSPLKAKMEYYIEPAEQTEEVQDQLKEMVRQRAWRNRNLTTDCTDVTDSEIAADSCSSVPSVSSVVDLSLNPESLTLLDPACGSGHILVEAYDLFKAIYQERGYRAKDIPALILRKNLFGMEIDDRAAQLAAFALMMKARADDRRIFDSEAKPNILAFEDSQGMKASEIHFALTSPLKGEEEGELESPAPDGHLFEPDDNLFTRAEAAKAAASRTPTTLNFSQADIASLLELFENAKTFGSLIQVLPKLAMKLPEIEKRLDDVLTFGDLTHASAHVLKPLLQQARLLARQYDAVVANPPYMGTKGLLSEVKSYLKKHYPDGEKDLFTAFIVRGRTLAHAHSELGFMSPFTWMFIGSFSSLRSLLLEHTTPTTLIQLEYSGFAEATVPICTFTFHNSHTPRFRSTFIKLSAFRGPELQPVKTLEAIANRQCGWLYDIFVDDLSLVPDSPFAFWIGNSTRKAFTQFVALTELREPQVGLQTSNTDRFIRFWAEVDFQNTRVDCIDNNDAQTSGARWFPLDKGGSVRRWYGNKEFVVNWYDNGREVKEYVAQQYPYLKGNTDYVVKDRGFFFSAGVTWNKITSADFSARLSDVGSIFSDAGMKLPCSRGEELHFFTALLNSTVVRHFLRAMSPTLNCEKGAIEKIPVARPNQTVASLADACVEIAKTDWDSRETSWDFQQLPALQHKAATLQVSQEEADITSLSRFSRLKELENDNNRLFIEAYGLQDELLPEVPDDQITLYRPDRADDIKRLISYSIGCIMGRYSLDKPGLIYAHSGNQGFDASQYKTFRADDDGIIPLLQTDWGIRDDATNRFVEFIGMAWPKEHLEENLKFVADSLGPTGSEQPRDTIRRHLSTGFYKHHLSMYKKRPIYWLFSSGKQRAFQCLVYLHRYHEGTLARMRTEYVIPLQGQIAARIEQLEGDKAKATSTSHRKKLQKEQDDLKKQQTELLSFEEKLKHAADQKISLDLDDGVKVNYAKFGDLLAEVKAVCGSKDED